MEDKEIEIIEIGNYFYARQKNNPHGEIGIGKTIEEAKDDLKTLLALYGDNDETED